MDTPRKPVDEFDNIEIEADPELEAIEAEQTFYDDEQNDVESELMADVLLDALEGEEFEDDCLERYQEDSYEESYIY